jgi:hypothetical protein
LREGLAFLSDCLDLREKWICRTAGHAGQLLGISPTTLSYWLNGHREPTTASLKHVVGFFEVDMWCS